MYGKSGKNDENLRIMGKTDNLREISYLFF
jgi:hypothetical protein